MNTKTAPHTNAQFYAAIDNNNLPPALLADRARRIEELSINPLPSFKGAIGYDILYLDHPSYTAVMVYRVPDCHRILGYGSRIINPNTGKREAVFISECPVTRELWYSMDRDEFNPLTQAYWVNESLSVSPYLRFAAGCIAKKAMIYHDKLMVKPGPVSPTGTVTYTHGQGLVFRTPTAASDVWELPLPNGSNRTLRTFNPAEGR